MAGYSGKTVSQKLGLKPGFCIFVDGAPSDYRQLVGGWPEGAKIVSQPKVPLDLAHLFATEARGLAGKLRKYRSAIVPDGMIWVSWPKKASGMATDLSGIVVRDAAPPLGLVDVKVCAVDEVWSAPKFVIPKAQRGKRPRQGADPAARRVTTFDFIGEDGRWRIDNFRGREWTVREILTLWLKGP